MPTSLRLRIFASLRLLALQASVGLLLLSGVPGANSQNSPSRVANGLLVFYDFQAFEGSSVKDRAGVAAPLDLRIADSKAVRHGDGALEVLGKTLVHSEKPASRLGEDIKSSGAITIEVWMRPAKLDQSGPARIVTLSRNANERNFTLGQDGDKIEVRLRTTKTSTNGMPSLASKPKSLGTDWTHVVYTFDRAGKAKLYVNGKLNVEQSIGGAPSNWDGGFQFALANELSNDRPWLGALRLVAIYGRDLSSSEVEQNFRAGTPTAPSSADELLAQQRHGNAKLFETRVAPLISKHCLECHDTVSKKGKLDLSRKATAQASGAKVVVAVKSADSLLWKKVASNEMPHDRPPLSGDEKKWLQQWIDGGATWSLDFIDPAVYAHGDETQKVFVQRLTVPEYIETVRSTLGVDISKEAREVLPRDLRADDENVTKVIEPIGRRLLRGPVSKDEVTRYCGISTSVAAAGGHFEDAIRYIVEAMLQLPRFLYRI